MERYTHCLDSPMGHLLYFALCSLFFSSFAVLHRCLMLNQYNSLKKDYQTTVLEASDINTLGDTLLQLEQDKDCYLIKPNNCFNKIPIDVYQHLIERTGCDNMGILIDSLTNNYSEPSQYDEILDKILDSMQKRIDYSFANRHIDVYCQSGLLKLAKEGRLTDHLDGMPAFDQIEKRMIFEYIRDRNADPADSYTLYITRDTIFENNYVISVFKGLGILIEYTLEKSQKGMFSSLMVENEMIAETFADYVENHVPHVHAMSKDETMSFLDELIEMCQ